MIFERAKEKNYAENDKTSQVYKLNNDLCSKMKQMDLRDSHNSEKRDISSNSECKMKLQKNCEEDSINKISENLANFTIKDDQTTDTYELQGKETDQMPKNISCEDNTKENNLVGINIIDDNEALSNDNYHDPVKVAQSEPKENNIKEEVAESDSSISNKETKEKKTDFEKKSEEEISTETKKVDNILCSRGPIPHSNNFDASYQPYTVCSRSHQSKGRVSVAEPVGPLPCMYMQQHSVPAYNITPNTSEPVAPPKTSFSNSLSDKGFEEPADDEIKYMVREILNIGNPLINTLIDEYSKNQGGGEEVGPVPSKFTSPVKCQYSTSDSGASSASSHDGDSSPIGSPQGVVCQRPPQSTSANTVDSGMVSPRNSPFIRTEYPSASPESSSHNFVTERTTIWVSSIEEYLKPVAVPVPVPVLVPVSVSAPAPVPEKTRCKLVDILPKPEPARTRFMKKLNEDRRLQAWVKICACSVEELTVGDEKDGDTQLMIAISNEFVGQLEFIYAVVERIRHIPGSLAKVNKAGESALYLACKLLPHQPLVAAFIAEALLDQNVDVSQLKYGELTLPQMLQKEGNTHLEVLKELLAVRHRSGRRAFQFSSHDVNGNI